MTCFFVVVVSFLTHDNSLLFYFIRYIIGNFFMVVLSVYVCVFLHLSAIFVRLSASCHVATCFFVVVVHFSLDNSLLFYFIRYIIGNFFVVVLSVYVCVYLHPLDFCEAFCIMLHCNLIVC